VIIFALKNILEFMLDICRETHVGLEVNWLLYKKSDINKNRRENNLYVKFTNIRFYKKPTNS
jgi:hypothetical protein